MPTSSDAIEISVATEATDELLDAFAQLIPQLSGSAPVMGRSALAEIIAAPGNSVLLARDNAAGGKIVGALTLVVFRIPTAVRAWIEDVVVDASARGRGVGELLTQEAMALAAKRGAQTIDLTSRPSRAAARRLYERAGFSIRDTNVYRYVIPARERRLTLVYGFLPRVQRNAVVEAVRDRLQSYIRHLEVSVICARADMESAHGVPHVANDQRSITKVIGLIPCRADRCCHDGRCLSSQTSGS